MEGNDRDRDEYELLKDFESYLRLERGMSPHTCEAYSSDVCHLAEYLKVEGKTSVSTEEKTCTDFSARCAISASEREVRQESYPASEVTSHF